MTLDGDSLKGLSAEVIAGHVTYLGHVLVQASPHLMGEVTCRIRSEYDAKREQEVWRKLLTKAEKTPWAESIRQRMEAAAADGAH